MKKFKTFREFSFDILYVKFSSYLNSNDLFADAITYLGLSGKRIDTCNVLLNDKQDSH